MEFDNETISKHSFTYPLHDVSISYLASVTTSLLETASRECYKYTTKKKRVKAVNNFRKVSVETRRVLLIKSREKLFRFEKSIVCFHCELSVVLFQQFFVCCFFTLSASVYSA